MFQLSDFKRGDIKQFEILYKKYQVRLERFAYEYLEDRTEAQDVIQSLFMSLWEKRESISDNVNWDAYMLTITKNLCIDHLRKRVLQRQFVDRTQEEYEYRTRLNLVALEDFDSHNILFSELEDKLHKVLDSLPKEVRESFLLSRDQGLKYQEIADKQCVSIKTVEKRISAALTILRRELREYSFFI
ncbi:MAG: RNA polymerase sigma-70 factor [Bacteroidales bacterium]